MAIWRETHKTTKSGQSLTSNTTAHYKTIEHEDSHYTFDFLYILVVAVHFDGWTCHCSDSRSYILFVQGARAPFLVHHLAYLSLVGWIIHSLSKPAAPHCARLFLPLLYELVFWIIESIILSTTTALRLNGNQSFPDQLGYALYQMAVQTMAHLKVKTII